MRRKTQHRSCLPQFLISFSVLAIFSIIIIISVPLIAENAFGTPSQLLTTWQRFNFGLRLILNSTDLLMPLNPSGEEQLFVIEYGEDASQISHRLEQMGLIADAKIFQTYLAWTGMDAYIQVGTYRISTAMSAQTIAGMLQSTTMTEVSFVILSGWRMEEIASSLPTSGLNITADEFLAAAFAFDADPYFIPVGKPAEGFLYPDTYVLPRSTSAEQLLSVLVQGFIVHFPDDFPSAFQSHGLSIYEGVTLASIIEREAVVDDEMPLIASVFLNRLFIGMKLQADPTVQYALGFNALQGTWWTNPLSGNDLQYSSPYNTYLFAGLPPGPISNPGSSALTAVAYPAVSSYYYFQARCDDSGLHNFAETLQQHEANYCP